MRHSLSFFFFFFFFLVILFLATVDADIVTDTCQKAAQSNQNIHYDFCVAVLGGDPKSHSSDLPGLFNISLELTKANATNIGSRIGELLNNRTLDPDVKERLQDCQELYSDTDFAIEDAVVAFNSKNYIKANQEVSSVMDAASSCEDGFKDVPGLESPLSAENNGFFQLSAIALAITNLVH